MKGTGFSRYMKSLENQLGSSLKGTGFSLKGTGFSLKGTGFSPYIQSLENRRGFSPEGHFPPPKSDGTFCNKPRHRRCPKRLSLQWRYASQTG